VLAANPLAMAPRMRHHVPVEDLMPMDHTMMAAPGIAWRGGARHAVGLPAPLPE
jgi:hypothetical protein